MSPALSPTVPSGSSGSSIGVFHLRFFELLKFFEIRFYAKFKIVDQVNRTHLLLPPSCDVNFKFSLNL